MKSVIQVVLVLGVFAQAIPAHALVELKEHCTTSDDKYEISITDNEGLGLDRTPQLVATIKDQEGDIAGQYQVDYVSPPIRSTSFGHDDYLDSDTQGKEFDFAMPSTNTPKGVTAVLSDGTRIDYTKRGDLRCAN